MCVHEFGLYSGAILTVSCIWVWIRRPALPAATGLSRPSRFSPGIALSSRSGVTAVSAFSSVSPGVPQSLRAPARLLVLVQFALAVLAALAIDDLLAIGDGAARDLRARTALWIPAVSASPRRSS